MASGGSLAAASKPAVRLSRSDRVWRCPCERVEHELRNATQRTAVDAAGHAFLWHVLEQYDTLRHREQRMRGASPEPHHSQLHEDMTTVRPRRDQCCEWPSCPGGMQATAFPITGIIE